MQLPPHDTGIWRLRFTLTDQPGRLAASAAALADLGVNILNLDVHVVSATEVIDEATVSLPAWLDVPAVEHALHRTGARNVWAVPVSAHRLDDIATRVLRLAAAIAAKGAEEGALCDAIADLVDAELVVCTTAASGLLGHAQSSADDPVRLGRGHIKRLPSRDGAWTMAVPDDQATPGRIVVAARRSAPFTSTEGARTLALLQALAAAAAQSPRPATPATRRAGPELSIAPLTASHLADVTDLHDRCSPESRYSRYFSPMPISRSDVLLPLLDVERGRIALGAWIGDRLVGMANACPSGADADACWELAVLVEDDHQRQGIGTRLVREVISAGAARGTKRFIVVTLAGNRAMICIVRRIAPDALVERDGDIVTLRFSNPAPAGAAAR